MTDKTDAEFEAWWQQQLWRECFEDVKDQMRNVWVARGEQMAVQLPPAIPMPDEDRYDDPDMFERDEAVAMTANGMRYACRAAVVAAGFKVKE